MKLLVWEQHPRARIFFRDEASKLGLVCIFAKSNDCPCALIEEHIPDITWLDYDLAGQYTLMTLASLSRLPPPRPVILTIPRNGIPHSELGCTTSFPFLLHKPLDRDGIRATLKYVQSSFFKHHPGGPENNYGIVGISSFIRELRHKIIRLSKFPLPVLIVGETGTGKGLIAKALHQTNPARKGAFITVDCGALSPALIENELFGHVRGAFTGAEQPALGLVREAHGGTLFLDEVGELPGHVQCKLLRVIQEREVRPLGSTQTFPVDVRILAATNDDLAARTGARSFREDLYFRLSALTICAPALRQHVEDIPFLVHSFGESHAMAKPLSAEALHSLMNYSWPGNIRELQNTLLRAWTMSDSAMVTTFDLFDSTTHPQRGATNVGDFAEGSPNLQSAGAPSREPAYSLAACEKAHILQVLLDSKGDKLDTARRLGIGKTTLYRKLKLFAVNE